MYSTYGFSPEEMYRALASMGIPLNFKPAPKPNVPRGALEIPLTRGVFYAPVFAEYVEFDGRPYVVYTAPEGWKICDDIPDYDPSDPWHEFLMYFRIHYMGLPVEDYRPAIFFGDPPEDMIEAYRYYNAVVRESKGQWESHNAFNSATITAYNRLSKEQSREAIDRCRNLPHY
jgi:hypothetical protein